MQGKRAAVVKFHYRTSNLWHKKVHLTENAICSIKHVFSYFPFGFEGRIWDLIVSVPDHCLSFYFSLMLNVSYVSKLFKNNSQ